MRFFIMCNLIFANFIFLTGCKKSGQNASDNSKQIEIAQADNKPKKLSSYYGDIKDALGKRLPIEVESTEFSKKFLINKDSPYYDRFASEILRIESNETQSAIVDSVPSSPLFVIRMYTKYETKEVRATVIYYPGLIEVVPYAIQTRDDLMEKIREITVEVLGEK